MNINTICSVIGLELILSVRSEQFHKSEFWRKAEEHTRKNAIPRENYEDKKKVSSLFHNSEAPPMFTYPVYTRVQAM